MIRKAIIPVAGWGTRLLPATKALPKPMLPIADLPTIHYIVEEAVQSGIECIILVTGRHTHAVEDYFYDVPELTQTLTAKGDDQRLSRLREIENMARFCFVRQPEQLGLGHAVLMAADMIGDEPFAVLLGDDLMFTGAGTPVLRQMMDVYAAQDRKGSILSAMRVPEASIPSYGVIAGETFASRLTRVRNLIEKPKIEEAPSNLAIMGRYILTPEIFDALRRTPPGRGNEIQLTDALCALLQTQPIYAYEFAGARYDAGDFTGWLTTSIEYTLRRPDLAPGLKAYLRNLKLD